MPRRHSYSIFSDYLFYLFFSQKSTYFTFSGLSRHLEMFDNRFCSEEAIVRISCKNFLNRFFQTRFEESIILELSFAAIIVYQVIFARVSWIIYESRTNRRNKRDGFSEFREGKEKIGGTHVRNGATFIKFLPVLSATQRVGKLHHRCVRSHVSRK